MRIFIIGLSLFASFLSVTPAFAQISCRTNFDCREFSGASCSQGRCVFGQPGSNQGQGVTGSIDQALASLENQILNPLITLLALGAFLFFIWGVVEFIRSGSQGKMSEEGKRHMLWGLVGLAILFGARALLSIIGATAQSLF